MKRVIMTAAMAVLLPATAAWAGDKHEGMGHNMGDNKYGAMTNTTLHEHGHRIEGSEKKDGAEHQKMGHKMSERERGPMGSVDAYKKGSDRLQGEREEMKHKMNGNAHGAMSDTTPHEHGRRLD